MSDADPDGAVVIPWARLSPEALRGVIEEFITREGTEYGGREIILEREVARVQRQLERGEVVVVFDAASETVGLSTADALARPAPQKAT